MEANLLKREEQAVFALRSLYRKYGYLPYKMSKFEEYEYYIRNKDFLFSDRVITFNDTNGKLLALKPDVTLSIVKNGEDRPGCKQKVCYNENVYRVSERTHRYKEELQAGLECIGDIDLYDVYEVVSLAAQSLALISGDFILEISHLGILSALLDGACKDVRFQQEATRYIAGKNAHDLERLCRQYGVDQGRAACLTGFISAYGQRDQVLARLRELCGEAAAGALEELETLSALLDRSPYSGKIIFDFSVVNNRNYYNGILFKGFLSGICDGVLAGGQYDKLMEKLERKAGAVGFALYLDLLEQLPAPKNAYDVDVLLLYGEKTDKAALAELVEQLVAEGRTVSAQRSIPPKLRCRELLRMEEEGAPC